MKIHLAMISYSSLETDSWMQKKVDPLLFKIGRAQAAKNKWVEMGKQLVSRKVSHRVLSYINMLYSLLFFFPGGRGWGSWMSYEVQNW